MIPGTPAKNPTGETGLRSRFYLSPLGIAVFGVFCCLPILISGALLTADDTHFHVIWHNCFSRQLFSGDLYPRWLLEQNDGLGAPTFRFYGPLAFYISALISICLQKYSELYHIAAAATLFVALSGVSCFYWLKRRYSSRSAAIASILYVVAPYHLAIDFYKRFAFAELLPFVIIPLLLLSVDQLEKRIIGRKILLIGVAYACLILSHPPTTLIFSAVLPIYALFSAKKGEASVRFLQTIVGMVLGVGCAAFYFFPALFDQNLVRIELYHTDYFDYRNWFLFPPSTSAKLVLILAGTTLAHLFFLLIAAAIGFRTWSAEIKRINIFWITVALGSCFMMCKASNLIWEAIPMLQMVQFTFRYNILVVLATGPIVAQAVSAVPLLTSRSGRFVTWGVLLVFVILSGIITTLVFRYMNRPLSETFTEELDFITRPQLKVLPRDFLPNASPYLSLGYILQIQKLFNDDNEQKVHIFDGEGEVSVVKWTASEIILDVHADSPLRFGIRQLYFELDRIELTGSQQVAEISPDPKYGIVQIKAPSGRYLLKLFQVRTKSELLGDIISSLTLLICGLIFTYKANPKRSR